MSRRFNLLPTPALLAILGGALYLVVLLAQTPHLNDTFERLASTGIVILIFFIAYRVQRRIALIAAERDATERLIDEMRKLERFRREFVSNVTHELRTPLTGIRGAVDVLEEDASLSPEDRTAMFKVLREQTVRLDRLARDILSLARIEQEQAGDRKDFEDCDLSNVVSNAVTLLAPKAAAQGVQLRLERNDRFRMRCDVALVEEAVSNLIENAMRYSGSPSIEVSLIADADSCRIEVTDHGIGIAPEHHPRIFERFYRVDKARSRALGGTGLGLAIVKHIAQLHGGEVSLSSVPGEGCTFTIAFHG